MEKGLKYEEVDFSVIILIHLKNKYEKLVGKFN
jgi:hypothetical protein